MKILEKTGLFYFHYKTKQNRSLNTLEVIPKQLLKHYSYTFRGVFFLAGRPEIHTISPNFSRDRQERVLKSDINVLQDGIFDSANEIFRKSVTVEIEDKGVHFYSDFCKVEFDLVKAYQATTLDGTKSSFNIGVATANTPFFSTSEKNKIIELINLLADVSRSYNCHLNFRISEALIENEMLHAKIREGNDNSASLEKFLEDIDILFTTKSTIILDGLQAGVPVVEFRHRSLGMSLSLLQIHDASDIKAFFDCLTRQTNLISGWDLCSRIDPGYE